MENSPTDNDERYGILNNQQLDYFSIACSDNSKENIECPLCGESFAYLWISRPRTINAQFW